ncbi:hypothetical protein ABOM_005860 [Aspergillus bombycis]|uniref:NAD-dependent epimerase/dehydratase domain-containing protein n=1 Tax=Aspergillus bombycis TaxID=109264 RepID=A0A1F8A0I3_9EURO|nr:hypothetical protein ABOM_005860 [Aspergillus bombycis]OGM45242.1 hypothetical protein ABOM_005860 [Aspergillus bombycis]
MPTPSVLVTGANGYIGNAVCRAFVRAGWTVYGLARRSEALPALSEEEIIPVQGALGDLSFLPPLFAKQKTFNAIVSTTDDVYNFDSHFNDILSLLLAVAKSSNAAGVRPIVIFTSGCKDYGMTGRADSPDLAAHTENSPLNPPPAVKARAVNAVRVFDYKDAFDAVVTRPTTVYGRSGSYYGPFFELAQEAKETGQPLTLPSYPTSIVHGTHVDDCAEAYVAIAESERARVAGQCYNISARRYEVLEEIAQALVKEYGIGGDVVYAPPSKAPGEDFDIIQVLTGFSQWVGSEKLRQDVGWKDRKLLFSEGVKAYRVAYEEAVRSGHSNVQRVRGYIKDFKASA